MFRQFAADFTSILREPFGPELCFGATGGEKRDWRMCMCKRAQINFSVFGAAIRGSKCPLARVVPTAHLSLLYRIATQFIPATRLTESHRRRAKGGLSNLPANYAPRLPTVCRACGALIKRGQRYCASCAARVSKAELVKAAQRGRVASHTREAQARRAETQRQQHAVRQAWQPSQQPAWLDESNYREKIQPRLAGVTVIAMALGISEPYATDIRAGKRRPHARHWQTLARLVGESPHE